MGTIRIFAVCLSVLVWITAALAQSSDRSTDALPNNPQPKLHLEPDFFQIAAKMRGTLLPDIKDREFHKVKVMSFALESFSLRPTVAFGWLIPETQELACVDGIRYPIVSDEGKYDFNSFVIEPKESIIRSYLQPIDRPSVATLAMVAPLPDPTYFELVSSKLSNYRYSLGQNNLPKWLLGRYLFKLLQQLILCSDYGALEAAKMAEDVARLCPKPTYDYEPPVDIELYRRLRLDMETRIQRPVYCFDKSLAARLNPKDRVAYYLNCLRDFGARGKRSEGSLPQFGESVMHAIVAEGEWIVPYLIDALDTEKGFTRSLSTFEHIGYIQTPKISTIAEQLQILLISLWPQIRYYDSNRSWPTTQQLRAEWNRASKQNRAERWFEIIADKQSDDFAFIHSATALFYGHWDSYDEHVAWYNLPTHIYAWDLPIEKQTLITGLLKARIDSIQAQLISSENLDSNSLSDLYRLTDYLARWDLRQASKELNLASAYCYRDVLSNAFGRSEFSRIYTKFLTYRLDLGDNSAKEELKSLIANCDIEGQPLESLLLPLSRLTRGEITGQLRNVFQQLLTSNSQNQGNPMARRFYLFESLVENAMYSPNVIRLACAELINDSQAIGSVKISQTKDSTIYTWHFFGYPEFQSTTFDKSRVADDKSYVQLVSLGDLIAFSSKPRYDIRLFRFAKDGSTRAKEKRLARENMLAGNKDRIFREKRFGIDYGSSYLFYRSGSLKDLAPKHAPTPIARTARP